MGLIERDDCTVPYFGFKAKHTMWNPLCLANCTVPYFGFKAKHAKLLADLMTYCTVPYFGFKAKPYLVSVLLFRIVLCLILDSRQNRPLHGK